MCSKNRLCLKQVTAFYVKKKKVFSEFKGKWKNVWQKLVVT